MTVIRTIVRFIVGYAIGRVLAIVLLIVIGLLIAGGHGSENHPAPEVVQQRAQRHDEEAAARYREEEREAAYRGQGGPAPVQGWEP